MSLYSLCQQEDEDGTEGVKRYQVSLYALDPPLLVIFRLN